ncbi:Uncharacterised protein [Kingella potus]|uniref:Uncharacterized protein n=1 Tax=Kingella potus TaxID=265175 RepID=A0A377R3N8_9NEIS|nr:hypothetical protein [Kingella potus]UOO99868.1 hypothetical protein LVJ84_07175 [Kingella potus]STR03121.1 Uncharacterised protein [Kingella potus]
MGGDESVLQAVRQPETKGRLKNRPEIRRSPTAVIPAQAGILSEAQPKPDKTAETEAVKKIPACAGMTERTGRLKNRFLPLA